MGTLKTPTNLSEHAERLGRALDDRTATVGVMGLGYVGLPLAVAFAESGLTVLGFEVDATKVETLLEGRSYIGDISDDSLAPHIASGKIIPTTDMDRLAEADAISICVPTPLRKTRDPDMSYVTKAVELISPHLRAGQLVVLESTSYPGTTEELFVPMVTDQELEVGHDVFVGSSPERVDPANETWTIQNTPKVVGGVTETCTWLASKLYSAVTSTVVPVSRPMAAELTKLFENTFRAVNIGLANEMALICRDLGVDTWEVINAAATKPFGFMPFYPGPGIGGHCIPVDPLYLSWKLRPQRTQTRFIDLADDVNRSMPSYVVTRITDLLNDTGLAIRGTRILVLGVAYKKNVSDVRESPALDILTDLVRLGADVTYADPHVPEVRLNGTKLAAVPLDADRLAGASLTVVLTDHDAFDPEMIVAHAAKVLDTRNLTRGRRDNEHVYSL